MIPLLADENFDNRILRGLLLRDATIDVIRVQDTEIHQADDPTVLEWAANHNRIIVTHDFNTMPKHAYERIDAAKPMLGVVIVPSSMPLGDAIDDMFLLMGASEPDEFAGRVIHLPLK